MSESSTSKLKQDNNDNADGKRVKLTNKYLAKLTTDNLYHLALGTNQDLQKMFGDVKFVCMGGTGQRMLNLANYLKSELGYKLPDGEELRDLSAASHRFALYKVGPILTVSHGMGLSSVSILLHEIVKLMYYAKCQDPVFIRVGTCGGVGVKPGTVVITEEAVDGVLEKSHEFTILGKRVRRPAIFDKNLVNHIKSFSQPEDEFDTILGTTLAADDFYEAQGRVDGAICEHTEEEKFEFLKKIHALGVRNIEMEATIFGAFTHYTKIKGAIVCVTLINRLNGDQVEEPKDTLGKWQLRPKIIVGRYIKHTLNKLG